MQINLTEAQKNFLSNPPRGFKAKVFKEFEEKYGKDKTVQYTVNRMIRDELKNIPTNNPIHYQVLSIAIIEANKAMAKSKAAIDQANKPIKEIESTVKS